MSNKTTRLVYTYPVRKNFNAQIVLPYDLTLEEARRLTAFLLTLAVPKEIPDETLRPNR